MKEIKNVLLVLLISVCSLLLVNVMTVKAQAGIGFSNLNPVCDPSEDLKLGEKTTCYVLGKGTVTVPEGDNAEKQGLTHGFVVRMYTTDGLLFDEVQPYINNTNAVAYSASAGSDTQNSFKAGDETVNFTCSFNGNLAAENSAYQFEAGDIYKCAIYYSNSKDPLITVKSGEPTTNIQGLTGKDNGIMVIGKVIAHIDENKKGETSCGELCVYSTEIKTTSEYQNGLQSSERYLCTEVHFKDDSSTSPGPNTGAFASYALLAAGALIAVSAVAIAKKHNKIYRV